MKIARAQTLTQRSRDARFQPFCEPGALGSVSLAIADATHEWMSMLIRRP